MPSTLPYPQPAGYMKLDEVGRYFSLRKHRAISSFQCGTPVYTAVPITSRPYSSLRFILVRYSGAVIWFEKSPGHLSSQSGDDFHTAVPITSRPYSSLRFILVRYSGAVIWFEKSPGHLSSQSGDAFTSILITAAHIARCASSW
ncbi:UvrABC system protein [Trichinella pseudospiralis]